MTKRIETTKLRVEHDKEAIVTHEQTTSEQFSLLGKFMRVTVLVTSIENTPTVEVHSNGELVARTIPHAWWAFRFEGDGARLRLFGAWRLWKGHRVDCLQLPCICQQLVEADEHTAMIKRFAERMDVG